MGCHYWSRIKEKKSPIEVSADILSRLNHIAEQRLAGELSGVVITVPLILMMLNAKVRKMQHALQG